MKQLLDFFKDPKSQYRWYRPELIEKFEELEPGSKSLAIAILNTFHPAETIIYRNDVYDKLKKVERLELIKE